MGDNNRPTQIWVLQLAGLAVLIFILWLEAFAPDFDTPVAAWPMVGFAIGGPEFAARWPQDRPKR